MQLLWCIPAFSLDMQTLTIWPNFKQELALYNTLMGLMFIVNSYDTFDSDMIVR